MNGKQKFNLYAVVSLIFGILVWVIMITSWVNVWIFGLFAIVASEKFKRLNKAAGGTLKGKVPALIGIILGTISFLMGITNMVLENLQKTM
jgi:hypothetical protein